MGFLVAGIVMAVAAVATAGVQYASSQEELQEQQQQLHTQQLENQYKTVVRKNQTIDRVKVALENNQAHMAMTGAASNSPSFFAANSNIVEKGDQAMRNADTSEALNNYSYQIQEENDRRRADLQQTGAIIQGASGVARAYTGYKADSEMTGGRSYG